MFHQSKNALHILTHILERSGNVHLSIACSRNLHGSRPWLALMTSSLDDKSIPLDVCPWASSYKESVADSMIRLFGSFPIGATPQISRPGTVATISQSPFRPNLTMNRTASSPTRSGNQNSRRVSLTIAQISRVTRFFHFQTSSSPSHLS